MIYRTHPEFTLTFSTGEKIYDDEDGREWRRYVYGGFTAN